MSKNLPNLEEWRKLYQAVNQVKEIAPWEWMEETDIFGVQNPETDELGFVSVMGMLGEHYAVGVYLGLAGLYGFWDFQEKGQYLASPESLFEIPQLQASFEDRAELLDEDYKILKKLGLKFRGKRAWPLFRSIRPGFVPWLLEPDEARFLRYVLEQTVDVALRFKDDPSLVDSSDEEGYLVRVPSQKNGALTWEDRMMRMSPPEPRSIPIAMDAKMLEALKHKPQTRRQFEVDLFMFPTPIKEKDTRPFFPYILLTVDAGSAMILGNEFFQPLPSLEAMWGLIPVKLASQFMLFGIIPKEISVRSDLLVKLLQPLAQELGIKLKQSRKLRSLDSVKEALFQHFM